MVTKRTDFSADVLEVASPTFPLETGERLAREDFGVIGRARPLSSERDQNFIVRAGDGRAVLLKIANRAESAEVVDFQIGALEHIANRDPDLPVPRVIPTVHGPPTTVVVGPDGAPHIVRMLSFLPGRPLPDPPTSPKLLRNLGISLARLGRALRGYSHPAASYGLLWSIKEAGRLRAHLCAIEHERRRGRAGEILDRFETYVRPMMGHLRAQVIHSDATPDNVLRAADDPDAIGGFIDFGDMVHAPLVNDPAIALASAIIEHPDPAGAVCALAAGYHAVTPLLEEELALLWDLTVTRVAMIGIIRAWRAAQSKLHQRTADFDEAVWKTLERLERLEPAEITERVCAYCGPVPGP